MKSDEWIVIGAVRDLAKMEEIAVFEEFDNIQNFKPMYCDLGIISHLTNNSKQAFIDSCVFIASFSSVREFVNNLIEYKAERPIDRLVCNAAVYQPTLDYAKYTEDDIEQQAQINHLSHFLMCSLLVSRFQCHIIVECLYIIVECLYIMQVYVFLSCRSLKC